MVSCWILVPESGVITVKNGHASAVSVVVRPGLHPFIEYEGKHVYPVEWRGFVWHGGTSEHWLYPTGPVREVRVRKENDDSNWVLVVWK